MSRKRGITLILALLIVSVVVAIGITVSTVVIFQVRLNRVTAQSHQGYYAAESGIEQGLNRVTSLQSTTTLSAALGTLQGLALPTKKTDGSDETNLDSTYYSAGKHYLSFSQKGSALSDPADLQEGQSTYVDIFNVDASLGTIATPTLCLYALGKDIDGTAGSDSAGNEILEVSWVAWDATGKTSAPQKVYLSYSQFTGNNCSGGQGASVPITQFYPAFTPNGGTYAGYRIRVTALRPTDEPPGTSGWGDVTNLLATPSITTDSQILLKSISDTGGQKQALKATFPWALPLSSLFDFVIFSEKSLSKTLPVTIAQEVRQYGPYPISGCVGNPVVCTIPTAPFTTPIPNCGISNPCTYYIRLTAADPTTGWSQIGATVDTDSSSTDTPVDISVLNGASCILKTPYLFAASTGTVTFTNKPAGLASYTLLTTPAFSSADEYYCP